MKKLIVGLTLLQGILSYSQVDYHECGRYTPEEHRVQDSIDQENLQSEYLEFYETYDPNKRSAYIIPVVVHIVHIGGEENISDDQVYSAITQLNEDYAATNVEIGSVSPTFAGVVGNADIEFRLASKDPNGNCHKGITRTFSQTTYDNGSGAIINAVEAEHGNWSQNKYMNVFICIDPNGNGGYTNYPGNWYNEYSMEGSIFIRHQQFGTMGTSFPSSGTTFAHEVGHWLNLRHCWGNSNNPGLVGNCGEDDLVADTPNSIGWSGCVVDGVSCSEVNNVQNYMEYAGCRYMFTQGQAIRMQAALESPTAGRNKLWTPENLEATGTDAPSGELCQAEFTSGDHIVCQGSTIDFHDYSFNGIISRTWTFDGGSPSTSTDEDPVITYNSPGVYAVTLEVSDGVSTMSTTSTEYVIVLSDPGELSTFSEGFEAMSVFPDNQKFMVENDDSQNTWERYNGTGSTGNHCLKLDNYGNFNGSFDSFTSGTIDLSNVDPSDNIVFNFKYAYRKANAYNDEALKFYISKDCGQTWALRKNIADDNLGSAVQTSPYEPSPGSIEWQQADVYNINSTYFVSTFRFKIEFENDGGNNVYIDDINLYPASQLNLEETTNQTGFSVYPNPTNNIVNIDLYGTSGENYEIAIFNALGQKVADIFNGELLEGLSHFTYSMDNLPKGVYYVRISGEGRLETSKLVKE